MRLEYRLDIPNVRPEEVSVIIGADFKRAHDVLETKRGKRHSDPQAELTRFGWVLFGKVSNRYKLNSSKRQRHVNSVKRIEPNETLKRDLERLWTTESFGIKPDVQLPVTPEERRAWKILKTSTKHNGERYECSLLWSSDEVKLPDNREAARKRFYGIERRLNCKRDYAERYASAMSRYMELGHARLLTAPELPGPVVRTWYLPHHGVENNGKLRTDFDA